MDLDIDQLEVPPTSFDSVITLPSSDFHKLCRDMNYISDNVYYSYFRNLYLK